MLWYSTVRAAGSGRAGLLTGVAPLSAAVVDAVSGGGVPGPLVWLGIAVVITGLLVGLRPREGGSAETVAPGVEPDQGARSAAGVSG